MIWFLDIMLPVIGLITLALFLPWWLGRILPQRIWALWLNAMLAGLILTIISAGFFWLAWGMPQMAWTVIGLAVYKGMMTSIIWVPMVVVALILQPQHWKAQP